jgi:hypothetical protein
MKWRRACNPLGPGLRGLVTANVPDTGRVPRGAQSGFVLSAPPGTTISRLRWSGVAHRRDCRYALQLYAERPGASPVSIKNVRANRHCPNPEVAQKSSRPRLRAFDLGGATRIIQRVVCVGTPSREYCSARGQNYIGTLAAEATVVDGSAPSAGVVQDEPLAQGKWVSGKQGVRYEASDNVGIKSASVLIGGAVRGSDSKSCSYSQRIPCPNSPGFIEVNTAEVPEGSQPLAVVAEDAAGNRAESAAVTARIDNAAPGAIAVGVGGGEAWRNSNDFDLAWTKPRRTTRSAEALTVFGRLLVKRPYISCPSHPSALLGSSLRLRVIQSARSIVCGVHSTTSVSLSTGLEGPAAVTSTSISMRLEAITKPDRPAARLVRDQANACGYGRSRIKTTSRKRGLPLPGNSISTAGPSGPSHSPAMGCLGEKVL